jgi:hypothetical protein
VPLARIVPFFLRRYLLMNMQLIPVGVRSLVAFAVVSCAVGCGGDEVPQELDSEADTERPPTDEDTEGSADDVTEPVDAPDSGATDVAPDTAPEDVLQPVDTAPSCEPGTLSCATPREFRTCNAAGNGYTVEACFTGTYCVSDEQLCVAGVCEPYTQRCLGIEGEREICAPDASVWQPSSACQDGEYCVGGACALRECLPQVMFAVDGSSSMASEWPAIRASIAAVTAANPDVAFGMTMFPTSFGCSISGQGTGFFGNEPPIYWPQVPITLDGAARIDTWFAENNLANGSTPLIATVEWFGENVEEIWGEFPENGHLIVMSEGADTCRCDDSASCIADALGTATLRLAGQGVNVYVIGYNFSASREILNAIAENGGTPFTEFIPAGNEATLTEAFSAVVGNAKICQ